MGMKFVSGNFRNATNNRLECINSKLKSVISRYSSLEELVEKFFLILRVIRSEQDQKAALAAQKLPIAFYSVKCINSELHAILDTICVSICVQAAAVDG